MRACSSADRVFTSRPASLIFSSDFLLSSWMTFRSSSRPTTAHSRSGCLLFRRIAVEDRLREQEEEGRISVVPSRSRTSALRRTSTYRSSHRGFPAHRSLGFERREDFAESHRSGLATGFWEGVEKMFASASREPSSLRSLPTGDRTEPSSDSYGAVFPVGEIDQPAAFQFSFIMSPEDRHRAPV